jgi:16S rRNA (uracil1498-N3)-methyltransferase
MRPDPDAKLRPPVSCADTLHAGDTVRLDADAAAALRWRKINTREAFTLRDGAGTYFRAALQQLDADSAEALAYEQMDVAPESPLRIHLVCAVLQRQRMLVVAQKAAELGVWALQPVLTLKSVPADGLAHEKAHAWPGQSLKGTRQCRRARVPPVWPAVALSACFAEAWWRDAALRVFLDDRSAPEAAAALDALAASPAARDVVLVVGPEGGFADTERAALRGAGALPLRLGGRVLRAETAVFAGVSVLQHRLGDMGW